MAEGIMRLDMRRLKAYGKHFSGAWKEDSYVVGGIRMLEMRFVVDANWWTLRTQDLDAVQIPLPTSRFAVMHPRIQPRMRRMNLLAARKSLFSI